jgi:hypothetical protein
MTSKRKLNLSHASWLPDLELLGRQIPMGGNNDGVYKHSAGENWASEVSRLEAWDQNGPHCPCKYHIPCDLSRLRYCVGYVLSE